MPQRRALENGMSSAPLIVHVIHRLDIGGMENGLVNLLNGMTGRNYRHAIVTLAGFSEFRRRLQRLDVTVESIDKRPGKDFAAYGRLWRRLRVLQPDIVHTRNLGTIDCQWVAACAGVRRRIHGEHGWVVSDLAGTRPRSLRVRRFCAPVIHRFVAMSRDIERWMTDTVGIPAQRITQIYNGVDSRRFAPDGERAEWPWTADEAPLVIGTVGRIEPTKNQEALVHAFARVLEQAPELAQRLRLMIVGEGPQLESLRTSPVATSLGRRIWFPGAREDVAALMRRMDIFVLPSLNEGISNTILEAMACGRPIVAARVGGNPELLVHGVTGVLYESNNEAAFVECLVAYARDRALRQAHGAAARLRAVEQFSLDAMVSRYTHLYDDTLN
jgi:sugar transferase (PEP-CTERM/EpsH1 system associated)